MGNAKFDCNQRAATTVCNTIYEFNRLMAEKLHIDEQDVIDIVEGKIIVDRVIFQDRAKPNAQRHMGLQKGLKRLGIAAMAVMLIMCLSVQGMADSLRASILRVFAGQKAVHVESVTYDRYADLTGYVVPTMMPSGYTSNYHTTTADMLYMSYINDAGRQIQYYYYPCGASAHYDNEHAEHHIVDSKFGTIHVWKSESGHTTACLLVGEAYVQMDFDTDATDGEIQKIVDGLNHVN